MKAVITNRLNNFFSSERVTAEVLLGYKHSQKQIDHLASPFSEEQTHERSNDERRILVCAKQSLVANGDLDGMDATIFVLLAGDSIALHFVGVREHGDVVPRRSVYKKSQEKDQSSPKDRTGTASREYDQSHAKAPKPLRDQGIVSVGLLLCYRPSNGICSITFTRHATQRRLCHRASAGRIHRAVGVPISDPAYQRGVQYLLKTSKPDGTWHVQTRVFPFQKYFESGFPYGKDQWISAAATSWAVMALTLTIEPASAGNSVLW